MGEIALEVLCWISDYPLSGTGFGNVTYEITKRLDYKIFILSLGYKGIPIKVDSKVDILPLDSEKQINYYMEKLKPDYTIIHHSFYFLEQLKNVEWKGKNIVYIPVEGDPLPLNYRNLLTRCNKIIVPSSYSQNVLKKAGIDSKIVPHGVDTSFFIPRQQEWKEVRFGYIGQNDIRKQIPRIMEAYARLGKGILTIASNNDGTYNLIGEAKNLNISPIFIEKKLNGLPLPRENVRDFYQSLSVYVNVSTEGFGLPALEAAACGVPSICLDHGASREVLGPGALYCSPESFLHSTIGKVGLVSIRDLYQKMRFLIDVPEAREKIGRKALERSKMWSWEDSVKKMENEIRNV